MIEESFITFQSGARRCPLSEDVRYDLITPFGLRRLAATYAEGAKKYGDRNWEKGIPESDLINRALRHIMNYMAFGSGPAEDDLAHAVWNLMAVMHFQEVESMLS